MNTAHVRNIADADLTESIALPSSAGTVVSTGIDMGAGVHVAGAELRVEVPVLDATELPDTETTTYTVEDSADDVTYAALCEVGVQTGAGGVGAAATSYRFTPSSTGDRYYRISALSSASAGDQSGKSVAIKVVV